MSLNRILTAIIAIVLIGLTITALILYFRPPSTPPNDQLESATVGAEFSLVNTLLFIAQNTSYFSDNGLNVTIQPYVSGAAALDAMINGDVNIAASSEFTVVNRVIDNSDVGIMATIDRFQQINIVARKDRGIQNITDLANKTVGLTTGTSAHFFFGRFLELNGFNLSMVKIVNTQPNNMVEALTNGSLDAVITWEPYLSQIKNQMASEVVEWSAQSGQQVYCVLSTTSNWINNHNQTSTQFFKAISQAENYVQSNPADAKSIIRNHLNYTVEYIDSVWSNHQFTLSMDQSLVLIMEDEARWLIANNLTNAKSVPDFQSHIFSDTLRQAKSNP